MTPIQSDDTLVWIAVSRYLDARKTAAQPISTRQAVLALRTALPKCHLSDRQLVDMVAMSAVERGRSVFFDGNDKSRL